MFLKSVLSIPLNNYTYIYLWILYPCHRRLHKGGDCSLCGSLLRPQFLVQFQTPSRCSVNIYLNN